MDWDLQRRDFEIKMNQNNIVNVELYFDDNLNIVNIRATDGNDYIYVTDELEANIQTAFISFENKYSHKTEPMVSYGENIYMIQGWSDSDGTFYNIFSIGLNYENSPYILKGSCLIS